MTRLKLASQRADMSCTMKSSSRPWFAPLRRAVLAFFKHDIALRRQDGRVQVVFESCGSAGGAQRVPTPSDQAAMRDARDLGLARTELARLLDGDAGLRSALRPLAFVEGALEREGWLALHTVPHDVLELALSQFEELITNWSSEGLACLRSKMAVALTERAHQEESPEAQAEAQRVLAGLEGPQVLAARAIEAAMAPAGDDDAALLAAYAALGVDVAQRQAQ